MTVEDQYTITTFENFGLCPTTVNKTFPLNSKVLLCVVDFSYSITLYIVEISFRSPSQ